MEIKEVIKRLKKIKKEGVWAIGEENISPYNEALQFAIKELEKKAINKQEKK